MDHRALAIGSTTYHAHPIRWGILHGERVFAGPPNPHTCVACSEGWPVMWRNTIGPS